MDTKDLTPVSENTETDHLAEIGTKVDYCMQQYRPYIIHGFNRYHLSVVTNIPETDIENFFSQSSQPFDQYIDQWRVKYAKTLINTGKVRSMEMKTIGSLSGFSSAKKFIEAYRKIEGISPEIYHLQIEKSASL
ncbi:MAG: hypothetical protein K9H16_12255 [Bacteroidales bacterium]|nr:hypothetical protein [Bacteroidales bacterium]